MRKCFFRSVAALLLPFVGACSDGDGAISQPEQPTVEVTASDFVSNSSHRAAIAPDETGELVFNWKWNDLIGVFGEEGAQTNFYLKSGKDTKTAVFTTKVIDMPKSSKYMAYYPMQKADNIKKEAIAVSLAAQSQDGNASTDHLGQFTYLAAATTAATDGKIAFKAELQCALVELELTLPVTGNSVGVKLSADDAIFANKGTIDLTADKLQIVPVEPSKEMIFPLVNFAATPDNPIARIYMMTIPMDWSNKTIKIEYAGMHGTFDGEKMEAGHAYKYSVTLEKEEKPIQELWVDMGLSVLWASRNLGAKTPEEYGDYYSWGELEPKEIYESSVLGGQEIESISGDKKYDAATAQYGEHVRMPSDEEFKELIANTTQLWANRNGVVGREFTSLVNGATIFFPCPGYRHNEAGDAAEKIGHYWSGTSKGNNTWAEYMYIDEGQVNVYPNDRHFGFSIRPVSEAKAEPEPQPEPDNGTDAEGGLNDMTKG